MMCSLHAQVQSLLDELVASGQEIGLQAAAYVDNEQVVDAWAGIADEATGRPVDGDTLFTCWSTTKGFTATCLHILADRGQVEYDAPVAKYWPEFAANGKEQVTVRHALTHMAGVPQMPEAATPETITDWDTMCTAIAGHAPLWKPGTQTGYHAWTFGWIIGEIVFRVDGRPLALFAQEELCRPLGIEEFYLGVSDEAEKRVAPLREVVQETQATSQQSELARLTAPRHIQNLDVLNRSDVRRASLPAGGGIMNARAIARHYAMLANHGELDGVRLLSPERIDLMRTLQTDAKDLVLGNRFRKGLGYFMGGAEEAATFVALGQSEGVFGHPGAGGSIGFADPERKLAFGLTKNLMTKHPDPKQSAAYRVAEAIREYVDGESAR